MLQRVRFLASVGLLVALMAACNIQIVIPSISPVDFDVSLSNADSVRTFSLGPEGSKSFLVAAGEASGQQIVVMSSEGTVVTAETLDGTHLLSSSFEDFFTTVDLRTSTTARASMASTPSGVRPAITVTGPADFRCIGPCVALRSAGVDETIRVSVKNLFSTTETVSLYVVDAPYFDQASEPSNDSSSGAMSVGSQHALERVGDQDWYQITADGTYQFIGQPDLAMRARIYVGETEVDSVVFGGGNGNASKPLFSGDLVQVTVENSAQAATAAYSYYSITGP